MIIFTYIIMGSVRMKSLDKIKVGEVCIVVGVKSDTFMARRFLDIGIIPGAIIEKVLASPFKGICAYLVMGSIFAIRDKDALGVEVCCE